MVRDLRRLADTRFDVLVIGAGFYGAVAAWDAALRGLSVALIDQGDFGGATSFNNLKTLHGGLRSLQSLDFRQMRLFIRERRALARVAPHLVRPMPFVVPTYRHPWRNRTALSAALRVNDFFARDRNDGIADDALHLPASRALSREECLRLNPAIDPRGVTGGGLWYDYQMRNTDRVTFGFVSAAAGRGAEVANYVRAIGLIWEANRVAGAHVEDRLSASGFAIRAHAVVNATGPWAGSVVEWLGIPATRPAHQLSLAMNLVTRRVPATHACGGLTRGRYLFLVPWRNVTMIGTSHDIHDGRPDALAVTPAEVHALLDGAREAFPRAALTVDDIRLVHRGLLPMVSGTRSHVKLLRESTVIDHTRDRAPGLISIFSVRYTTARATAAAAVDTVFRTRGIGKAPPSATDTTPISGGALTNVEGFVADVVARYPTIATPDDRRRIAWSYGSACSRVFALAAGRPDLAAPLGATCGVTGAEVVYAVREEAAVRLSDVLLRRTEAGSAGHPGREVLVRAAELMAAELDWTDRRTQAEIDATHAFYQLPL